MADWKQHHANEAEKVLESEMVQNVLTEFAKNMGFKRTGLPEYGLVKIVSYVAQVARAQALGFDPYLLRMSDEEADEQGLMMARVAAEAGQPVWVIEESSGEAEEESG